jgi:hypothetical protein
MHFRLYLGVEKSDCKGFYSDIYLLDQWGLYSLSLQDPHFSPDPWEYIFSLHLWSLNSPLVKYGPEIEVDNVNWQI